MPVSRRLLLSLLLVAPALRPGTAAADAAAVAVIRHFYDDLLAVMKEGKRLGFDGRYARLAPVIERTDDLALMSRLSIGPEWAQLTPAQQQRLTEVFSRYTISVYAQRFDDYGGERFEVDPNSAANPNGTLVKTWLVKSNGEKVTLNYLMRSGPGGQWRVIDVYLSGTISELATRRSEFVAVLHSSGADGLVRMIEQRAAAARNG